MKVIATLFSLVLALNMMLTASEKKDIVPQNDERTAAQIKSEKRKNLALFCLKGTGLLACAWALWATSSAAYEAVKILRADPREKAHESRKELLKKKARCLEK